MTAGLYCAAVDFFTSKDRANPSFSLWHFANEPIGQITLRANSCKTLTESTSFNSSDSVLHFGLMIRSDVQPLCKGFRKRSNNVCAQENFLLKFLFVDISGA